MRHFASILAATLIALALGGACSSGGGVDCPPGAERCPCSNGRTCDAGLACASDLCVALGGGSGGSMATGGTGTAGEPPGVGGNGGAPRRGPCTQVAFVGDDASDGTTTPDQFVGWLSSHGVTVTRISSTSPLTAEALEPLHAIVVGNMTARVGDGAAYGSDDIANVQSWVQSGGGLITLAGYTADEQAAQPADMLLEPLGLGYDFTGRGAGVLGEGEPPVVSTGIVGAGHPTVAGVTTVGVYFAYPVTGDGTSLLEEQGFVLAMAKEVGEGRVFAYGDEYSTFAGEWAAAPTLQHELLWTNVLGWLLEPSGCQLAN